MNEYDRFAYLDKGRFTLMKRAWLVVLALAVAAFIILMHKPPLWASDKLPAVPVYPGSTLIENTIYDPQLLVGGDPVAERMVMEIPTDPKYFNSIGSDDTSYSESFDEFYRELAKNNWMVHTGRSCPDFLWWNAGYPATREDFSNIQDDSKVWTLIMESAPDPTQVGITRLTITVTKGYQYKGCLKVGF